VSRTHFPGPSGEWMGDTTLRKVLSAWISAATLSHVFRSTFRVLGASETDGVIREPRTSVEAGTCALESAYGVKPAYLDRSTFSRATTIECKNWCDYCIRPLIRELSEVVPTEKELTNNTPPHPHLYRLAVLKCRKQILRLLHDETIILRFPRMRPCSLLLFSAGGLSTRPPFIHIRKFSSCPLKKAQLSRPERAAPMADPVTLLSRFSAPNFLKLSMLAHSPGLRIPSSEKWRAKNRLLCGYSLVAMKEDASFTPSLTQADGGRSSALLKVSCDLVKKGRSSVHHRFLEGKPTAEPSPPRPDKLARNRESRGLF